MSLRAWFRRWLAEGQDDWHPTGYRLTTDSSYLYDKARAGYWRSRRQSARGQALPQPKTEKVQPFQRKQAK